MDCLPCYAPAERQQCFCLSGGVRSRDMSRWLMLEDYLEYLWRQWLWAAEEPGTRGESSTKYPCQPQLWKLPALFCGLLQSLLNSLNHKRVLISPLGVHKTRDGKRHVPLAPVIWCWQYYPWTYYTAPTPVFLLALPNPNHSVRLCSFLPDAPSPVPFLEEAASL